MRESEAERRARQFMRDAQAQYDEARTAVHGWQERGAPVPEEDDARLREAGERLHRAAQALREARRRERAE